MKKIVFNSILPSPYDVHFSNFSPSLIEIEGIIYPTVEHAFQAQKTLDMVERLFISGLPTPGKARQMGRKLQLRKDWEEVKYDIMVVCLRKKFSATQYKRILAETRDAEIIEAAERWNDTEWGIGKDGTGKNLLGKALMQVREEMKT